MPECLDRPPVDQSAYVLFTINDDLRFKLYFNSWKWLSVYRCTSLVTSKPTHYDLGRLSALLNAKLFTLSLKDFPILDVILPWQHSDSGYRTLVSYSRVYWRSKLIIYEGYLHKYFLAFKCIRKSLQVPAWGGFSAWYAYVHAYIVWTYIATIPNHYESRSGMEDDVFGNTENLSKFFLNITSMYMLKNNNIFHIWSVNV